MPRYYHNVDAAVSPAFAEGDTEEAKDDGDSPSEI